MSASVELDAERALAREAHLDECPECRELVAGWLRMNEPPAEPRPPATLGRYVVLDCLGAGATGVVYAAFDPQLDRKVALKLLHSVDAAALVREARIQGRIAHPNVVPVHDVGAVGDRAYVAMELVRGPTLADWLRSPRTLRQVLGVFEQAGRGLAAAHAEGLVHRDFKPDNVLVGPDQAARVTDFGFARHAHSGGPIAGTPAFMAPEQLAGAPAEPASDQFSFCKALDTALAQQSRGVPRSLKRVIQRGLSTSPQDRFPNMPALLDAIDVARRRARAGRGIALAAAVAIAAGAIGGGWGAYRSRCSGGAGMLSRVWNPALRARMRAAFAATGKPYAAAAFESTASALDQYARRWAAQRMDACQSPTATDLQMACLDDQLRAFGTLIDALATSDAAAVERSVVSVESLPQAARCSDTRALTGALSPPTAAAASEAPDIRRALADVAALLGLARYSEATARAESAVARSAALGYPALEAEALLTLGRAQDHRDDFKAAEETLYRAVSRAEAGRETNALAGAYTELAELVGLRLARPGEGHRLAAIARGVLDANPGDAAAGLRVSGVEGLMLFEEGRYAEARDQHRRVLEGEQRLRGPRHWRVGYAAVDLGNDLWRLGELDRALEEYERARQLWEPVFGEHPMLADVYDNIGLVYGAQGKHRDAERLHRRALLIRERTLGPHDVAVANVLANLGMDLRKQGRLDEALSAYQGALSIRESALGADHPLVGRSHNQLCILLGCQRRWRDALAECERSLAVETKAWGGSHALVAESLDNRGHVLEGLGRHRDAIADFGRAIEITETARGPSHPLIADASSGMGEAWLSLGEPRRAVPALERALAIYDADPGSSSDAAQARLALAHARRRSR